jgi:acyl dehydratase
MGVHFALVGQPLKPCFSWALQGASLVTGRTCRAAGQGYIASMKTFDTLADLAAHVGQTVAVSNWITVTQEHINLFAQATGDHQWIHVDIERAKAGPFGAPIAHGFLTLSLIPRFFDEAIAITQVRMGVNYGLNKVRFIAPVPVDSRLRAHLKLLASDAIDNDGRQQTWEVTIEREGSAKPVCVAESLSRAYP